MTEKDSRIRTAGFFDLDHTITDRDSFRFFLEIYYLNQFVNWPYIPLLFLSIVMRKLRFISLQTFKERALVSLVGLNSTSIQKIGKSFTEKHLAYIIRKKALERINWHRKLGHCTFIITSCPDVYLLPLVEYLKFDGYYCSKLAYQDNKFTGKIAGRDCFGNEKSTKVQIVAEKNGIDLSQSYAYTDHESDLPILEIVGNPVAVTPTKKLRQIAVDRSWKIETW